jgi:signal transduction histidine kinase
MPDGGAIEVSLRHVQLEPDRSVRGEHVAAGNYAQITVTDTGCGMDAETITKIFEPYFTTKGDMGNGLGLPTASGIVAQSGGQIDLTSTPGVGTRVEILLPAIGVQAVEGASSRLRPLAAAA